MLPAKGYASHGESWSFALALRLGSFHLLRADGVEPVLVLDDVFAELDSIRRERWLRVCGWRSRSWSPPPSGRTFPSCWQVAASGWPMVM